MNDLPPKPIVKNMEEIESEWREQFIKIWQREIFPLLNLIWQPYKIEPYRSIYMKITNEFILNKIVDRLNCNGWPCYLTNEYGGKYIILLHPECKQHKLWYKIKKYFKDRWNV